MSCRHRKTVTRLSVIESGGGGGLSYMRYLANIPQNNCMLYCCLLYSYVYRFRGVFSHFRSGEGGFTKISSRVLSRIFGLGGGGEAVTSI